MQLTTAMIAKLWKEKYIKLIMEQIEHPIQTEEQKKFLEMRDAYLGNANNAKKSKSKGLKIVKAKDKTSDKYVESDKPRLLSEKTPFVRDQKTIEEYEAIFKQYHASNLKHAAYALLIANFHHLQEFLTQPLADLRGFLKYLSRKYKLPQKLYKNDKVVLDSVEEILKDVLPDGFKKEGMKLRIKYNQNLPCDNLQSPSIQKLLKSGYELLEVDIQEKDLAKMKQDKIDNFKTIKNNCVIVDKKTKKVLGIFQKKAISERTMCDLGFKLVNISSERFWQLSKRGDRRGNVVKNARHALKLAKHENKSKAEKELEKQIEKVMNSGYQATVGLNNFHKLKTAKLSTATIAVKESLEIWKFLISQLGLEISKIFKANLPVTFNSSLFVNKEFRQEYSQYLPHSECPFTTISLNRSNAVKPHRDMNCHNYSAMTVLALNEARSSNAGTCFYEWIDPNTGLPIEIIVDDGDLLIADTDSIHSARNVKEEDERYSVVFYTLKRLLSRPVFACKGSDIEEETEQRPDDAPINEETEQRPETPIDEETELWPQTPINEETSQYPEAPQTIDCGQFEINEETDLLEMDSGPKSVSRKRKFNVAMVQKPGSAQAPSGKLLFKFKRQKLDIDLQAGSKLDDARELEKPIEASLNSPMLNQFQQHLTSVSDQLSSISNNLSRPIGSFEEEVANIQPEKMDEYVSVVRKNMETGQ